MNIIKHINNEKSYQQIRYDRKPSHYENIIMAMLLYLYDRKNEFLLILIPEINYLINYLYKNRLDISRIGKVRCIVTLIAIKYEYFKLSLKKRISLHEDRNFYLSNTKFFLEFILDIKILIITIFLSVLKNKKITNQMLKSAFITFVTLINKENKNLFGIHERLFSCFFTNEQTNLEIKLNYELNHSTKILNNLSLFDFKFEVNEDIQGGLLKERIDLKSFTERNKDLINDKLLELLDTINLSEEERLKNYPILTKKLLEFLNYYIQTHFT